jgi:heme-degrading monooxygenase HmoA
MSEPVLEVAVLDVKAGRDDEFLAAFDTAKDIISAMPGYQRHELRRCVETPGRFLLLVWWASLAAHTEGFRKSPQYQTWKQLLHHFYDPFPRVEHYHPAI